MWTMLEQGEATNAYGMFSTLDNIAQISGTRLVRLIDGIGFEAEMDARRCERSRNKM